jgi:hypothetical protein
MRAGNDLRDLAHDRIDLVGQRAAVGVAEHDPAGTLLIGGAGAGESVGRIGAIAVEEMLAVEQRLLALGARGGDRLADGIEIVVVRRPERDTHMVIPRFGNEADGGGRGVEQRLQPGIIGERAADALHHAEGGEGGGELAVFGEKGGVGRVGAGIAALDVVEPE